MIFKTTPTQTVHLAYIITKMSEIGYDANFLALAFKWGSQDQGIYDLMNLWAEAKDGEQNEIIKDIRLLVHHWEHWESKKIPIIGHEVLTFPDSKSEMWVACWVRRDIVASGNSETDAIKSLFKTIAYQWIANEMPSEDGLRVGQTPRPPNDVVKEWRRRHQEAHKD